MTPDPFADADVDADRIRAAFAREALDITPGPVPLAAVRHAGRARRRRRTAVVSGLSVVGAVVTAVALVQGTRGAQDLPPSAPRIAAPPTVAPTPTVTPPVPAPTPPPVRTVRPGERVDAGAGWTVWLTADGKHGEGPDGPEEFRSVTDGNIDPTVPGLSHQSTDDGTGTFHSGLFYGTKEADRVVLRGAGGRKTFATLLELPGRPGWGVWYAHTAPGDDSAGTALYDRADRLLAELPAS